MYKQTVHCPKIPYSSQTTCGHDTTISDGFSIINLKRISQFSFLFQQEHTFGKTK